MSAVLKPMPDATHAIGIPQGADDILPPDALAPLGDLHRRFESRRQCLLAARRARQARFDAGEIPDVRTDTRAIRDAAWRVAPPPAALLDRRVEITGPVNPKMVINALNSGANCYMADFEDSTAPTWANLLAGQRALRDAVAGTLEFTGADGKHYALRPFGEQAVLIVRPRGWHLDEKHVRVDGRRLSGALFDAAVFAFHNANALAAKDRGPYFYLPKLQSMEEAQLWDEVLSRLEHALGLSPGQIKVTVLIETLPAVFEMDEILHALRTRVVGLNCGRWDYIFSYIKTFRRHRDRVLPERGQVTMTRPFLQAYSELLIQTCHRRGAHAMGGMAAQIPIPGDEDAHAAAMARVRADKLREVTAGHDGTWVAHPALVPLARAVFDERMPTPHQHHIGREEVLVGRDELLAPPPGSITRKGFESNVEVCVRYLAAWLSGHGCVPIHGMMEDAATAEIARAQLWQWLHHADPHTGTRAGPAPRPPSTPGGPAGTRAASPRGGDVGAHTPPIRLDDGTPIDFVLFEAVLLNLPSRLQRERVPGLDRVPEAIGMLERLTRADTLADFLTLPAYERLDDRAASMSTRLPEIPS